MNKAKNAIEPEDDEEDWQFWQGIVIEGWKPKAEGQRTNTKHQRKKSNDLRLRIQTVILWGLTDFLWKFM